MGNWKYYKKLFRNEAEYFKIKGAINVSDTWMCLILGEGGDEIVNQGRSRVKSFSQETVAIGQRTPRIGENGPKLRVKVQDARMILRTISPFFISNKLRTVSGTL